MQRELDNNKASQTIRTDEKIGVVINKYPRIISSRVVTMTVIELDYRHIIFTLLTAIKTQ